MVPSRVALLLLVSATTVSGHWLHGCYKLKLGCSTPTASISACAYKCRDRGAFFGLQTDNQGSRYCWCGSEAPSTGENGEPTDLSTCSDNNDPKWHCSSNSNEWCGRPATNNGSLSVSRSRHQALSLRSIYLGVSPRLRNSLCSYSFCPSIADFARIVGDEAYTVVYGCSNCRSLEKTRAPGYMLCDGGDTTTDEPMPAGLTMSAESTPAVAKITTSSLASSSAATTTAIVDATGRTCNWTPCLRVCPATAGAESSSTRRLLFSHDTNFVAEKAANGRELLAIPASADAGRDDGAKPSWSGTISTRNRRRAEARRR